MTNYREVLRLHGLGLNKTEIASSCQCARNTVAATLQRAANCGLQWPLPEEMSDKTLSERLFPSSASNSVYKTDYAYVHRDLQRSGVTLNLLWLEYCDRCRAAGEIPHQSPQFNKYYADYLAKANATMHLHDFGADASFCFSSHRWQTAFLQFGYRRVKKIAGVQRDAIPLAQGFQ